MKVIKYRIAIALVTTLIASTATAGKITEEVDRFKGTKTVAWQSFSDPGRGYSFNVYAFYSKPNDTKPYGYYTLLVPPYGTDSFSGCSDNYWLVDDKPAPELKAIFETMGSSQTFRSTPSRSMLENLAAAKKVEFKICNTESSISASDLGGITQLLDATR
jgi:hypothetical protein